METVITTAPMLLSFSKPARYSGGKSGAIFAIIPGESVTKTWSKLSGSPSTRLTEIRPSSCRLRELTRVL